MTSGEVSPDLDSFRELATNRRVIPVTRRLIADGETPIGLYRKLSQGAAGTFLLESADPGGVGSRYSIVGVRSTAVLSEVDGQARWISGVPPEGVPRSGNPLAALRETLGCQLRGSRNRRVRSAP
jgi:anthranilate synthase component 1